MLTHTELHERLLYGLPANADVLLRSGHHDEGRAAMLATLAEVGLELDRPLAATGDATAVTAIVMSVSMEHGVSVFVVPDDQLTPALRAALERCHGGTIDSDTEDEHPDLFAAYQELTAATAIDPLLAGYALGSHSGQLQAARFTGRFSRVYFVHEWL